jgi:hypothetical protein
VLEQQALQLAHLCGLGGGVCGCVGGVCVCVYALVGLSTRAGASGRAGVTVMACVCSQTGHTRQPTHARP